MSSSSGSGSIDASVRAATGSRSDLDRRRRRQHLAAGQLDAEARVDVAEARRPHVERRRAHRALGGGDQQRVARAGRLEGDEIQGGVLLGREHRGEHAAVEIASDVAEHERARGHVDREREHHGEAPLRRGQPAAATPPHARCRR
jgi:hypothetical protein